MNSFKHLLIGSLLVFSTFNAQALPITGTMEMGGSFFALDDNGDTTTTGSAAVAIDFDFFGLDKFLVNTADGSFAGLAGSYGDITDFQFDPFVAPISDFWTVGGFSFALTSATRGVTNDPDNFLVLSGYGVLSAAGFDDTAGGWSFTGNTTGTGIFSWSATSAVPEPGSLLLLSIGLIGFGVRKKL